MVSSGSHWPSEVVWHFRSQSKSGRQMNFQPPHLPFGPRNSAFYRGQLIIWPSVLIIMDINKKGIQFGQLFFTGDVGNELARKLICSWKTISDFKKMKNMNLGRRVDPVVLFWKFAVPRHIKLRNLEWSIKWDQLWFSIGCSFVSCTEKGIFRVVLVGQLRLECGPYCWRSRRM